MKAIGNLRLMILVLSCSAIQGELFFKCEVEQLGLVQITLEDVRMKLPKDILDVLESDDEFCLKYWFSKEGIGTAKQTPKCLGDFGDLNPFFSRATFDELMEEGILFELRSKEEVISAVSLPIKDHHSFEDRDPIEFRLPLEIDDIFCRKHQLDYPDVGLLKGVISYAGFPKYLQMESGYCTDTGVYYAFFKDPRVRYIPDVYIHGKDNIESSESSDQPNEHDSQRSTTELKTVSVQSGDQAEDKDAYPFAHLTGEQSPAANGQNSYPFAHLVPEEKQSPSTTATDATAPKDSEEQREHSRTHDSEESAKGGTQAYPFANLIPMSLNSRVKENSDEEVTTVKESENRGEKSAPAAYPFAHLGPQTAK
eukprot:gb/GECG01009247.1/.p1 GENE.gb/GECG01009247.1/~~gb/GECG01009247.1/.p1  ORF type:complete len:367 (+),score=61.52 gb/GECG01009247.1/:1-1101(+)